MAHGILLTASNQTWDFGLRLINNPNRTSGKPERRQRKDPVHRAAPAHDTGEGDPGQTQAPSRPGQGGVKLSEGRCQVWACDVGVVDSIHHTQG